MNSFHGHLTKFWFTDKSLSLFLGLLILTIFVLSPFRDRGEIFEVVFNLGFTLLMVLGVMAVVRRRVAWLLIVVYALATVSAHWFKYMSPTPTVILVSDVLTM